MVSGRSRRSWTFVPGRERSQDIIAETSQERPAKSGVVLPDISAGIRAQLHGASLVSEQSDCVDEPPYRLPTLAVVQSPEQPSQCQERRRHRTSVVSVLHQDRVAHLVVDPSSVPFDPLLW